MILEARQKSQDFKNSPKRKTSVYFEGGQFLKPRISITVITDSFYVYSISININHKKIKIIF